jgi:hypothetical protein
MSLKAFYLRTVCVLVVLAWVGAVEAAQTPRNGYSITGNARAQIGNGLPIPIGFTPAPNGRIVVEPGAIVFQTTGADPKNQTASPGVIVVAHPGTTALLPVFANNTMVFQVKTMIPIFGPTTPGFVGTPRTGPSTVTWCPGRPLPTASFNPGCASPVNPLYPTTGLLRYTKTLNQIGGSGGQTALGSPNNIASADVAIRVGGTPPCTVTAGGAGTNRCTLAFALATPNTMALGGYFGAFNTTQGMFNPGSAFFAGVNGAGIITALGLAVGSGIANPAVSYGGPGTTGKMTHSARSTVQGGTEKFTRTGSDMRVNGVGTFSSVSGGVSTRFLTGPNANRGWLNYTIPEPTVAAGAVAALAMLFGCHTVVRRRR